MREKQFTHKFGTISLGFYCLLASRRRGPHSPNEILRGGIRKNGEKGKKSEKREGKGGGKEGMRKE